MKLFNEHRGLQFSRHRIMHGGLGAKPPAAGGKGV